jgi:hypothetical protein
MTLSLFATVLALTPLAVSPPQPRVEPARSFFEDAPLDQAWIANVGKVSVFSPLPGRLRVEIDDLSNDPLATEKSSNVIRRTLDLDSLPANASRVQSARIGPLMTNGFVVALVIKEGESTAYHYLQCLGKAPSKDLLSVSRLESGSWSFSDALFTSTGQPYRIVDASGTLPGDGLEITFRRGWQKSTPSFVPTIEEKVYFNSCALAGANARAGILVDVEKFRPSR